QNWTSTPLPAYAARQGWRTTAPPTLAPARSQAASSVTGRSTSCIPRRPSTPKTTTPVSATTDWITFFILPRHTHRHGALWAYNMKRHLRKKMGRNCLFFYRVIMYLPDVPNEQKNASRRGRRRIDAVRTPSAPGLAGSASRPFHPNLRYINPP